MLKNTKKNSVNSPKTGENELKKKNNPSSRSCPKTRGLSEGKKKEKRKRKRKRKKKKEKEKRNKDGGGETNYPKGGVRESDGGQPTTKSFSVVFEEKFYV